MLIIGLNSLWTSLSAGDLRKSGRETQKKRKELEKDSRLVSVKNGPKHPIDSELEYN